jgi:peptide/nickel transport system permease protein
MTQYIIRRLLWMVPTLIGITLITFLMIQLAPGDPVKISIGVGGETLKAEGVSKQIIDEQRKLLGLDIPLWQRYPVWLWKVLHLDFGRSFKDFRPVWDVILERVPITVQIELISIFLAYVIAIPLGVHSAVKSGTFVERGTTVVLFILYSLPSFWVAYILLYFLAGGSFFRVFPIGGVSAPNAATFGILHWLADRLWHLALPILVLTYGSFAALSRYMRSSMLDVLRQDYIRTARAKGLSHRIVIFKHAMRNSLIPIITILAGLLPALIGGAIITETIFNIPGMGRLAFEAVLYRNYPVIMAEATISAVLTLLGILVSDILYAAVDPRIKYD